MSAVYRSGLGRDDPPGGDGGDAPASEDGRSILVFARGLGPQPADLVRLFERRDYFVAVGRDASTVAHSYFRSSAPVKFWSLDGTRVPYLNINKKMGAEVMRACLLEQRQRLETYVLEAGSRWVLGRRGSPGNIGAFEDECLVNGELPPDASTVSSRVFAYLCTRICQHEAHTHTAVLPRAALYGFTSGQHSQAAIGWHAAIVVRAVSLTIYVCVCVCVNISEGIPLGGTSLVGKGDTIGEPS